MPMAEAKHLTKATYREIFFLKCVYVFKCRSLLGEKKVLDPLELELQVVVNV